MNAEPNAPTAGSAGSALPAQPPAIKDAEASKDILYTLRHFHLGNPGVQEQLEPFGDDYLPALLAPYRDASRLRYDYPLFLYPVAEDGQAAEAAELAKPLSQFLSETLESVAPGADNARILKDNLPRIEQALRQATKDDEAPVPARPLLQQLGEQMVQQLGLDSDSSARLSDDLEKLLEAIPDGGQLLAYGRHPAIHLLIHVIRHQVIPRQAQFQEQLQEQILGLGRLLNIEKEKSDSGRKPEHLKESVGGSAELFDVNALSQVMDHSQGSVGMSAERRERVQTALEILKEYRQEPTLVRFVHLKDLDSTIFSDIEGFESVVSDDPCTTAQDLFDQEAARLAKVFAAARIAQLEIDDLYDASIHDPWFASFNWEAFSQHELLLVPAVIALETALRVANQAMPQFSRLLNSGRPVQIMVRVLAHANPGRDTEEDPFAHFRTELGYLGIAHRQAVVGQTSAARHEHLLQQFTTAFNATRTSLHLINIGMRPLGQGVGLNAWLVAGAALEGRVHPFFQLNPAQGDSFAERVDFSGNPQPDRDWPLHEFNYIDNDGEVIKTQSAFTFADYALLIPRLHRHFTPVPLVCESDNLLPIADYLALPQQQTDAYIPYVWAINANGELRQLAVSLTLVHACRDRLNYWHSLQEMAGIGSKYIEIGIAKARAEIQAAADAERAELLAAHEAEINSVRAEAASEVMGRLTEVLMGMDLTGATPRIAATTPVQPSPAAADVSEPTAEAEAPDEAETEEEIGGYEDPWIDSPLCTSCNDCLAINPLVFVYNDSNQAYIADASAGTFAQMVEAAEICPSDCIHPGKPLNDAEPGLDELIERAAAYN
ncbi:ferredoxin [endosymbiont of Riftia pachyptila]|uniref:Putative pyruvate flavodoxin/ferredoxin oxidoreductase n=1 Tax=endosymbiont of Riftia pachyptila (vent Ph05) TaxID=1048808 RepID=G2D935_9GAMM|nr:ferredoxin [endosymbiont of Riftia pachyptila]EGV52902.1 putative pyruvate flavodoxin/ferredoxin oxidoreductase [endosymbiont of Riftia pachyptila (vent Ph05)]